MSATENPKGRDPMTLVTKCCGLTADEIRKNGHRSICISNQTEPALPVEAVQRAMVDMVDVMRAISEWQKVDADSKDAVMTWLFRDMWSSGPRHSQAVARAINRAGELLRALEGK